MKYYKNNNIHIIEAPIEDFKIILCDKRKKQAAKKNYCNAGFFAGFSEQGSSFTLPVGHLVCDYDADNKWTKHYCNERGKFSGNKFTFDSGKFKYNNQLFNNKVSTFIIKDNKAFIEDIKNIPTGVDYAIAGIPIMRNGADVKFATYVKGQGWDGSPLYGTWHIFIGLKRDKKIVYIIGMKTTTYNMILTAEAYKKLKSLGMYDVIKLDGGGSFYMNVNGKVVASTTENRRINTIITFEDLEDNTDKDTTANKDNTSSTNKENVNPYPEPTTLVRYNTRGASAKWVQWYLNLRGYNCGTVDGIFGNNSVKALKYFQKDKNLVVDGICGSATRAKLKT